MTERELRDYFNKTYGFDKEWPDQYHVDAETYGNVCQAIFDNTRQHESLIMHYRSGWLGKIAFGVNNGIMFKNVELIINR